jgi:NAD dependent epimerase/dehydratase family enzyme
MDTTTAPPRPLRIVLPGGSGQVGQMLARHFQEQGHNVTVLTRGPYSAPWQSMYWDGLSDGDWTATLEGADLCINLTGRSVNCRQNAANRQAIYESRIHSTQLLGRVIAGLSAPPRVWINASAATVNPPALDAEGVDLPVAEAVFDLMIPHDGIAKNDRKATAGPSTSLRFAQDDRVFSSDSLHAGSTREKTSNEPWAVRRGFSARVARDWEAAFFAAETPSTRKIALRSAVVFSPAPGSAFGVLSNLVRFGLGGTQGSGHQFVCWIHEADYARAVDFLAAREDLQGPFNLAAPTPLPNRAFMAALRWAWDVPNGLPAPSLAIRLGAIFLRTEPELVLGSCRAVPKRLLDAGFEFEFPEWAEAAEDLVRRWRNME